MSWAFHADPSGRDDRHVSDRPQLRLRSATLDDAALVAEVLNECTSEYVGRPSSIEDAAARLHLGDPDRDFAIALDAAGGLVGFGHVWPAPPDEVRCYVRVRPSAKGQGVATALLAHLMPRTRELAADSGVPIGSSLTLTSWGRDESAPPLLEAQGFTPLRYFLQMRIDLRGTHATDVVAAAGIELIGYDPDQHDPGLFTAFREAFAEHWGDAGVDESNWWDENRNSLNAGYDPTLWFVAIEGKEIAGFSISRQRDENGQSVGWISLVGVRPRWRGRGIGEALLSHNLNAFRRRGVPAAALNVDAENMTGALRLYRKVGMEPKPSFTIWSKPLL